MKNSCKVVITIIFILIIQFLCLHIYNYIDCYANINYTYYEISIICIYLLSFVVFFVKGIPYYHPAVIFLFTFFIYNIGGTTLQLLGVYDFYSNVLFDTSKTIYNNETRYLTSLTIIYFLLFYNLGILIYGNSLRDNHWNYNEKWEKYGKLIFFLFLFPAFYYYYTLLFEIILFGGYKGTTNIDSGFTGTSTAPLIIRVSNDLFAFGYFIYLASKPPVKKTILLSVLYLTPLFLVSLFSGSRVLFLTQALLVLNYYWYRSAITKKIVVIIVFFFAFFAVFVGVLRSTANNDLQNAYNLMQKEDDNFIIGFLKSQSSGGHVIGMTINAINGGIFPTSIKYLYSPLYEPTGYTRNKKLNDYNTLADKISYIYCGNEFAYGAGTGSSIAAEFYSVCGLIGVSLLTFLYALGICHLNRLAYSSNDGMFILLLLLSGLYYTARAHPFYPIIHSLNLIILFIIFKFFTFRLSRV